jgi:hypothetical protein
MRPLTSFELLQYAHENDCPRDKKTCYNAAMRGNLKALKYPQENGGPWDRATGTLAAEKGRLEILQYLFDQNCPCDSKLVPDKHGAPLHCLLMGHRLGFSLSNARHSGRWRLWSIRNRVFLERTVLSFKFVIVNAEFFACSSILRSTCTHLLRVKCEDSFRNIN